MVTPKNEDPEESRQRWLTVSAESLINAAGMVRGLIPGLHFWSLLDLIPSFRARRKKTIQEVTTALVTQLAAGGIDPDLFDRLVSNEINRRMKVQFGITFLVFTFLFTAASYAIVVCDGVFKWGISPVAITSLIIETPIQFVGLLYIIARNLFPTVNSPAHPTLPKPRAVSPKTKAKANVA